MRTDRYSALIVTILIGTFVIACNEPDGSENLSALAMQGKRVFERNECNACHYLGDEEAAPKGPDLLDPFLANDSLFVQTHLSFVENSKMPPIELTRDQIRFVSRYVAELHSARRLTVSAAEADTRCPVCYAPVSISQANARKLSARFLGRKYHFECEDCLNTFKKAPEAFVELLRLYENQQAEAGLPY